jgi:hypothetical protein
MHWEILIIPLIALGVWVLGTVFRGAEDERQKALRQQPRRPGGPRPPQRRPATDLDRFLEEARRRREAAARPAPPPPPVARPPEPRPAERLPLRQREQARPTAVTRRPEPPPPPPLPLAEAVTVRRAEPVAEARPAVVVEAVPAPPPPPAPPAPATVEVRARTATGAAVQDQVAALLRSPRGAGAAFVLTEILGPPLCRRGR